ncbi:iron-containing redox enzyme family protein [Bacillus sp. 4A_MP3]
MELTSEKYHVVSEEELERVRKQHSWVADPIIKASEEILNEPFFKWLENVQHVKDLKSVVTQLWYHSATFPKVMGVMLGLTSLKENHMMPFYALHIYGEADHHEMLMQWMLKQNILENREEIDRHIPSNATNACVNLVYQLAIEQDRSKWLACLNSGIERCSNHFFIKMSEKLEELGANDPYFTVHVEADEHHSILGLEHLEDDQNEFRREVVIRKALEGISLWGFMLNSWIGVNRMPEFDLEGNVLNQKTCCKH